MLKYIQLSIFFLHSLLRIFWGHSPLIGSYSRFLRLFSEVIKWKNSRFCENCPRFSFSRWWIFLVINFKILHFAENRPCFLKNFGSHFAPLIIIYFGLAPSLRIQWKCWVCDGSEGKRFRAIFQTWFFVFVFANKNEPFFMFSILNFCFHFQLFADSLYFI